MKIFIYAVILTVAISVVAGFFVVGSPQEERLRRFDEQRTQDLQTIQWQIINYWQSKGMLPSDLDALTDSISGFTAPKDPQTGDSYDYQIRNSLSFALCANFVRPSLESPTNIPKPLYNGAEQNWQHQEGRVCFERMIDPQLYPPRPLKF